MTVLFSIMVFFYDWTDYLYIETRICYTRNLLLTWGRGNRDRRGLCGAGGLSSGGRLRGGRLSSGSDHGGGGGPGCEGGRWCAATETAGPLTVGTHVFRVVETLPPAGPVVTGSVRLHVTTVLWKQQPCWRHDMEMLIALLALCEGNPLGIRWIPLKKGQWCKAPFSLLLSRTSCSTNSLRWNETD